MLIWKELLDNTNPGIETSVRYRPLATRETSTSPDSPIVRLEISLAPSNVSIETFTWAPTTGSFFRESLTIIFITLSWQNSWLRVTDAEGVHI